ncbi:MAG: pyrroline-5-carboxylate reductase [Clostridia bacterium]|nr:pyrroline-5-carboxylate reductase [Clostridia bacterium]
MEIIKMKDKLKVGFIGCGNMGGALAEAVGKCDGVSLMLADRDNQRASELADRLGARLADSLQICHECEYVFLAVKPQGITALLGEIGMEVELSRPTLVSMLAGVSTAKLTELIKGKTDVIRIMPNISVKYGKGLVFISGGKGVADKRVEAVAELLQFTGECELIDESLIDAASAIGGSGPAFFYRFIDALARGGENCGLPYSDALRYAALTATGAAEMLLCSGKSAEMLAREVCSPGGSTIEGIQELDGKGLADIVMGAVNATYKRAMALGK